VKKVYFAVSSGYYVAAEFLDPSLFITHLVLVFCSSSCWGQWGAPFKRNPLKLCYFKLDWDEIWIGMKHGVIVLLSRIFDTTSYFQDMHMHVHI